MSPHRAVTLQPSDDEFRLVRIDTVLALTGFRSRQSIYSMIRKGEFPPQIKSNRRAAAWRLRDVRDWADSRQPDPLRRPIRPK